jgi:hypothetical protein
MKPNINSVEVHPQLGNNGHPVGRAMVGAGSLWSIKPVVVSYLHTFSGFFQGGTGCHLLVPPFVLPFSLVM